MSNEDREIRKSKIITTDKRNFISIPFPFSEAETSRLPLHLQSDTAPARRLIHWWYCRIRCHIDAPRSPRQARWGWLHGSSSCARTSRESPTGYAARPPPSRWWQQWRRYRRFGSQASRPIPVDSARNRSKRRPFRAPVEGFCASRWNYMGSRRWSAPWRGLERWIIPQKQPRHWRTQIWYHVIRDWSTSSRWRWFHWWSRWNLLTMPPISNSDESQ